MKTIQEIASIIDISAVRAESTWAEIQNILAAAKKYPFICLFSMPGMIDRIRPHLAEIPGVKLGGIVGFPSGGETLETKLFEARQMKEKGCDEVDMVLNIGKLKSGMLDEVKDEIVKVRAAVSPLPLKVILEVVLLTDEEIRRVEHIVNAKIRANIPLKEYRNIPIEEAKELGAIALFGEKYGDHVRVIQFGSSIEFCGGTHVAATGNIGMIKIVSESSVAAGVRRIEAYTGARVEEMLDTFQDTMRDLKALFNNAPDLSGAIRKYIEENAGLKKQVEDFMKEKEAQLKEKLLQNIQEINGVKVIKFCAAMIPADAVKNIAFQLRGEITENFFFVAGTIDHAKPMLTVMISDNLVAGGLKAGDLVREAAKLIQGGGGGQPHFATAGGKNPDGLNAAIEKVLELAGI